MAAVLQSNGEARAAVYTVVALRPPSPEPAAVPERVQLRDPRRTPTARGGTRRPGAGPRDAAQRVWPPPEPPAVELPDGRAATEAQRVLVDPGGRRAVARGSAAGEGARMTLADAPSPSATSSRASTASSASSGEGGMGVVVAATHVAARRSASRSSSCCPRAPRTAATASSASSARRAPRCSSRASTSPASSTSGTLETGAPYMVMEYLEGSDLDAELDDARAAARRRGRRLRAPGLRGDRRGARAGHRPPRPQAGEPLPRDRRRRRRPWSRCSTSASPSSPRRGSADAHGATRPGDGLAPLHVPRADAVGQADVDARTDIWALGVILYELLAGGRTPFDAETLMALNDQRAREAGGPARAHGADVPPAFEAVLTRCFEKEREQRYPDVAAFAAALVPYASARAAPYAERVARVSGVTVALTPPTGALPLDPARLQASEPALNVPGWRLVATTGGATSQPAGVAVKRRTWPVAAGIAAALVVGALGAVGVVRWRAGAAAPEASGLVAGASVAPPVVAEAPPARSVAPPAVTPAPATAAAPSASASASASASSAAPAAGVPKPKAGPRAGGAVPQVTAAPDIFSRGTRTR